MSTTTGYYAAPIKTRLSDDERIPKGWRWVDLQDVARLESGHTPSRKVSEYWTGGNVPWLSLKDIRGMTSRYVEDTIDKPTMLGIDNSSARMLPKGTVAFCRTASVGHVAILGRAMATSQDFVDWVCGPNLLPEYLYEAFKASGPTFASEMQGSTHQTIYMPTVKRFKVLLPPLPEQKRIADILDKADAIRRKRQEAKDLAGTFQQGLFCEMFGDPITNGMNWPVRSFGDLATNEDGRRKPVKASDRKDVQGVYPYYGASGIIDYVDSFLFDETALLIGEDGANLLARSTPIAFLATGKYWVNNHAHVVTPNGNATLLYLATHLNMRNIQDFVTGSAQPKLNQANLNKIPIPCPPTSMQEKFDRRVNTFDLIRGKQTVADKDVEDVFNSLVQRAFRGEL